MDFYYYSFENHNDEQEQIRQLRRNYREYGLSIFETFEEYCSDKIERDDDE